MRQGLVGLLAEVMDVRALRQAGGIDLDDRADQHDLPVRMRIGQRFDQAGIEAFVDHAVEAESRMRNIRMRRMDVVAVQRLFEMNHIDAAREAVRILMA